MEELEKIGRERVSSGRIEKGRGVEIRKNERGSKEGKIVHNRKGRGARVEGK